MFTSCAIDCGFDPRLSQHNKICICCFFAKHGALRSKSKDWLTQHSDNVFVVSICILIKLTKIFSWEYIQWNLCGPTPEFSDIL